MRKLEGMYKQRLIINLLITLMIALTIINVIQIYLFPVGILGVAITCVILFRCYSSSVSKLYDLQIAEEKVRVEKESRKHNTKVYNSYKSVLSDAAGNLPILSFADNNQKLLVNNDDRKKYLNELQEFLKTNYKVDFSNMNALIHPFINLLNEIQDLNKKLSTKVHVDILDDLHIKSNLVNNINILQQYHNYFLEKSDMYSLDQFSTGVGLDGENKVNEELALYDDLLLNIPNVRFEVEGNSVETDNLVISPFGVFAIEVKNLGSSGKFKIKIEKDGRWVKIYNNSSEPMQNVTSQTYRHIGLKQKLINQELKKLGYHDYLHIKPLIVMANDNVEIINECDVPVVRISNIYHYISKFPKELDEKMITSIKSIVEENMLPPKKYEIEDMSTYIENTMEYLDSNTIFYKNIYKVLEEIEKHTT
ncbi:MAG: NERD domain-containing protein [Clostridiales bacterium]|jgi:hypothetical protein|nr:NERD domain-containing protein [Clostridiales bacterium]